MSEDKHQKPGEISAADNMPPTCTIIGESSPLIPVDPKTSSNQRNRPLRAIKWNPNFGLPNLVKVKFVSYRTVSSFSSPVAERLLLVQSRTRTTSDVQWSSFMAHERLTEHHPSPGKATP